MILQRVGWLSVVRSFVAPFQFRFEGNKRSSGVFATKAARFRLAGWCDATRKYCPTVSANCRGRFHNRAFYKYACTHLPPPARPRLVLIVPRGSRYARYRSSNARVKRRAATRACTTGNARTEKAETRRGTVDEDGNCKLAKKKKKKKKKIKRKR